MSKISWTSEQNDAIYENGSNILVAAAARSGKTAVLVERIIQKIIKDNVDIDRLLVVTFTNAAASEMRERVLEAIYKKLEENPDDDKLQRQVTLLNKASICTIDSFCLEIVRNYFYELDNVSPNFRIADTTEIDLLKQEVLEELFERKYEEENEDFTKLLNTYTSYRDDTPLKDMILKIYTYIQSSPFPEQWLHEKIEMFHFAKEEGGLERDFSQTPWGKLLLKELEEELIDDISALQEVEDMLAQDAELEAFWKVIRSDIEMLENLKNNLNNWDRAFEISQNMSFISWPRKKVESELKEDSKTVRDDVKARLNKKKEKILISNSKDANEDIEKMYHILSKLENIILEFTTEFSKRKREKNIVDFNDIEHFALKILLKQDNDGNVEKTEVAKRYTEKFQEIAIDEYQDSNLVQEYILTSVAKENNIFMVGDVKQSIYKFRQAMPELFLDKYKTYQKKENKTPKDDLKIQLFKNFRSRDNILKFTNMIFENIMSDVLGVVDYNEEEFLNLGANYEDINQDLKTEIHIIDVAEQEIESSKEAIEGAESIKNAENAKNAVNISNTADGKEDDENENTEFSEEVERIEDVELEARFVAKKIKNLVDEKFQVWDRKQNKFRDIAYKDIVVLLRATSTAAPIYEQEILNLEIPVFSDSSQEYLDSTEIQTIMSLLQIIDNPIQDIPLVTVLRSPIGRFTDDDLVEMRLSDKYDNFYTCMQKAKVDVSEELKQKIQNFLDSLNQWRKEKEYLSLDEFIWKLYSDTGYYNYVGLMLNGELRQANLRMLFERAKQYETASFKGLYNFIKFIEKLKLSSGDLGAAKLIGENDNVVRIMSIHKSKGLEFPVVFLASTGKQFNLMDLNEKILLHQKLGLGVKYIDYERQVQYDTLTKAGIQNQILIETLSEEMRILYVALTRAKEKLIITGTLKDYPKQNEKMQKLICRYPRTNKKINPILIKKYKKYLDWIILVYSYEQSNSNNSENLMMLKVWDKAELKEQLKKKEKEEVNVLKELEESKATKEQLEEIEKLIHYEYKNKLATIIPTKTSVTELKQLALEKVSDVFPIPNFLKNKKEETITAAQKGTLVHLCMQKLDEKQKYDLSKIKELIETLRKKDIITPKEAESINPYKILEFTKTKIWEDLTLAKEIQKEKPFYIHIPVKEIYGKDAEEFEENVLVQGIMDLYYIDQNDNLVLVDYKTDYVENGKETDLISKYQKQLELYKDALENALQRKVDKVYIYSVYLGKEMSIKY